MNQGQKTNPDYQAQAILSRRDHSEHEIRAKLKTKKFTSEQINSTINKLKKRKLIDDTNFAAIYTKSILNSKPVGPKWIKYKLKQKGIAPAIISSIIAQTYTENLEQELAEQAIAKWRRLHPSTNSEQVLKEKKRLQRHLVSRGFSHKTLSLLSNHSYTPGV
jgi:regulatory protein